MRLDTRLAVVSRAAVAGLVAAAVLLGMGSPGPIAAQQDGAPPIRGETPLEQEALDRYRAEQMIGARTKAEEVLRGNPRSILGHFVLGCVLYKAEGSLARAMYHLGRARELYETRWSAVARPAGAPWPLHRETLLEIQALAGQMELHEYQLEIIGYHDYLYDPDLLGERVWPLMRLGRFDEARAYAERAMRSRYPHQQSLGRNGLCALEGEARRRTAHFEACKAAYEAALAERERGGENALAVHAYNAVLGALAAGRFDTARELATAATSRLEHTPANPWRLLVLLDLEEGRIQEAAAGLGSMERWRRAQPASLRDEDRAWTEVVFATVLLVVGEAETGLRLVDRAIAQPDRRGLTSGGQERALGAHVLLRMALRRLHAEREAERASARGWLRRLGRVPEMVGERAQNIADAERVRSVLADEDRLVATFRPYVQGGLAPLPVWLVGELVRVLGPGVAAAALARARAAEAEVDRQRLEPYFEAFEAEVRLEAGDETRAVALATRALERLPAREVLLRARTMLVGAEAARRIGRGATALRWLEEVMGIDPGAVRRLGLALPATMRTRGGALAAEAAERLERSPRLREGPGFQVTVAQSREGGQDALELCLLSPAGRRLQCGGATRRRVPIDEDAAATADAGVGGAPERPTPDRTRPETDDELVARAIDEFHREVFAPAVRLDSIDTTSLDGRVTTGQRVARERLQQLVGGAIEDARR